MTDRRPLASVILSKPGDLSLADFRRVACGDAEVTIDAATLRCMDESYTAARSRALRQQTYGVSTGLGPLIEVAVTSEDALGRFRTTIAPVFIRDEPLSKTLADLSSAMRGTN